MVVWAVVGRDGHGEEWTDLGRTSEVKSIGLFVEGLEMVARGSRMMLPTQVSGLCT